VYWEWRSSKRLTSHRIFTASKVLIPRFVLVILTTLGFYFWDILRLVDEFIICKILYCWYRNLSVFTENLNVMSILLQKNFGVVVSAQYLFSVQFNPLAGSFASYSYVDVSCNNGLPFLPWSRWNVCRYPRFRNCESRREENEQDMVTMWCPLLVIPFLGALSSSKNGTFFQRFDLIFLFRYGLFDGSDRNRSGVYFTRLAFRRKCPVARVQWCPTTRTVTTKSLVDLYSRSCPHLFIRFRIESSTLQSQVRRTIFSERKFSSTLHDPSTPRPGKPSWSSHRFSRLIANNFWLRQSQEKKGSPFHPQRLPNKGVPF
jgi:hypothetical protein